uniref:Uncharacterized protein n=1 Tax=Phaeodactylum tricornutum TaxID=2850 RepID=A0A8J9X168_PHATR
MDLSNKSFHDIFLQVMAGHPDDDIHRDAHMQDTRRSSHPNDTSPLPSDVVIGWRSLCGSVLPENIRAHAEAYSATAVSPHHSNTRRTTQATANSVTISNRTFPLDSKQLSDPSNVPASNHNENSYLYERHSPVPLVSPFLPDMTVWDNSMQLGLQPIFTDHDSTFASAFGKTYVSPETLPVPALPAPPPAFDRAHSLAFSVSSDCTSQSALFFHPISNPTHDPPVSPLKPCFLDTPEQPVVPDIVHNLPIEPRPTKKLRTTETINNDDLWPRALWPQPTPQLAINTTCAPLAPPPAQHDSQPVVLLPMPIVWPKTPPALNTNLTFDTPWLSAAQVATKKSDPVVKRNKDSEQISASTLVASRPSVVDPRLATFLERFDNAEWRLQALQAKNAELQAKVQEAERQKRAMQQLAR